MSTIDGATALRARWLRGERETRVDICVEGFTVVSYKGFLLKSTQIVQFLVRTLVQIRPGAFSVEAQRTVAARLGLWVRSGIRGPGRLRGGNRVIYMIFFHGYGLWRQFRVYLRVKLWRHSLDVSFQKLIAKVWNGRGVEEFV